MSKASIDEAGSDATPIRSIQPDFSSSHGFPCQHTFASAAVSGDSSGDSSRSFSPPTNGYESSRLVGNSFTASEQIVKIGEADSGQSARDFGCCSVNQSPSPSEGAFSCTSSYPMGAIEAGLLSSVSVKSEQFANHSAGLTTVSRNDSSAPVRKSQQVSGNHLLNFQYDPISRPQRSLRASSQRKPQTIKPYSKDLFLKANYKFVVLDTGGYDVELMDPDKMLQWEDVICVRYYSPSTVQCPICLERPLCPQITSCGHLYCFPCILRYLQLGNEDDGRECFKRCPLCFMMISTKELQSVYIINVKNYHVGDNAVFTLLGRSKSSYLPSLKNQHIPCSTPTNGQDSNENFCKIILTLDVDLSVREAKADLNNWLHMAEAGFVDDLEILPYVCAALVQLEERMKYWLDRKTFRSKSPEKNSTQYRCSTGDQRIVLSSGDTNISPTLCGGFEKVSLLDKDSEGMKSLDCNISTKRDFKENDSYIFYQVDDGQHVILHPMNMKCLLNHYGSYDLLPPRIFGPILELVTVTQSMDMRKRYRFLSHFSLTTTFQICEVDLTGLLPPSSLIPFMEGIKKREEQRKRVAEKEELERVKAEVDAVYESMIMIDRRYYSHKETDFSPDAFDALGSNAGPSNSPPNSDRKRFADVARLGFAAAHDSPPLKVESVTSRTQDVQASATATPSFASILSSAGAITKSENKASGVGKKGKKSSRVLLSTSVGRRY